MLTVVIPTYNRYDEVVNQVRFIRGEVGFEKVKLVVWDNGSDRDVGKILDDENLLGGVLFGRNQENIGLVGNLIKSLDSVKSDYVWYVGDDDFLSEGILSAILRCLEQECPNYVFINHRAVDVSGNELMASALPFQGVHDILEVFRYSRSTMMFITACVYKSELLRQCIKNDSMVKNRLTAPIYWSFYCAQWGRVSFIRDIYINNLWGNSSWSGSFHKVFCYDLPLDLCRILFMRYAKINSIRTILGYCPFYFRIILSFLYRKLIKHGR